MNIKLAERATPQSNISSKERNQESASSDKSPKIQDPKDNQNSGSSQGSKGKESSTITRQQTSLSGKEGKSPDDMASPPSVKVHPKFEATNSSIEIPGLSTTTIDEQNSQFVIIQRPNPRTGKTLVIRHLNLQDFKRLDCPRKTAPHNHKSCYYYHSIKDKRRDDDLYTPELCKFADTEKCPKHDKCRRAHNRVERLYHKDKYKTKFCHCYPNKISTCEYGEYCSFAHSIEDIKVRLVHHLLPQHADFDFYIFYFKTEWCPYNHEHNKAQCVYAHNFQDFRRKPNLFRYETELCEDWQSGTFITCYEEGCKRLEQCTYSHGWKEQQFHPLVYKTQPCEEQKCFKGFECPFFHSPKDRRILPDEQTSTDEEFEQLFEPHDRVIKCQQQPYITDLYFENNLNHMKELEILKSRYSSRRIQIKKPPESTNKVPQFSEAIQEEQEKISAECSSTIPLTTNATSHGQCTCGIGSGGSTPVGISSHQKELKPSKSFVDQPEDVDITQLLVPHLKHYHTDTQPKHESLVLQPLNEKSFKQQEILHQQLEYIRDQLVFNDQQRQIAFEHQLSHQQQNQMQDPQFFTRKSPPANPYQIEHQHYPAPHTLNQNPQQHVRPHYTSFGMIPMTQHHQHPSMDIRYAGGAPGYHPPPDQSRWYNQNAQPQHHQSLHQQQLYPFFEDHYYQQQQQQQQQQTSQAQHPHQMSVPSYRYHPSDLHHPAYPPPPTHQPQQPYSTNAGGSYQQGYFTGEQPQHQTPNYRQQQQQQQQYLYDSQKQAQFLQQSQVKSQQRQGGSGSGSGNETGQAMHQHKGGATAGGLTKHDIQKKLEFHQEVSEEGEDSFHSSNFSSSNQNEPQVKQQPQKGGFSMMKSCPQMQFNANLRHATSYQDRLNNLADSYQFKQVGVQNSEDTESLDKHAGATSISIAKLVLNEEDQITPHGSGPAVTHNSSDIKRRLQYFGDENNSGCANELEETTKWQHTQAIFKPKKFSPYKFQQQQYLPQRLWQKGGPTTTNTTLEKGQAQFK